MPNTKKKSEPKNQTNTSFSTCLWWLGGAVSSFGFYAAYQYLASSTPSEESSENAVTMSDMLTPVVTSAITLIPSLFLAMRDQRVVAPVAAVVALEGMHLLPAADAWKLKKPFEPVKKFVHSVGEKVEQSGRHAEKKIKQAYEHQKHYDNGGDWFRAADGEVGRWLGRRGREMMGGGSGGEGNVGFGVTTDGSSTTVTANVNNVPVLTLYKSDPQKPQYSQGAPSFTHFGEQAKTQPFLTSPTPDEVEKQLRDEIAEDTLSAAHAAIWEEMQLSRGAKKLVQGVSVGCTFHERTQKYGQDLTNSQKVCAGLGTAVEHGIVGTAGYAAGVGAGAVFPPAAVPAKILGSAIAGAPGNCAGNVVQEKCDQMVNLKGRTPFKYRK